MNRSLLEIVDIRNDTDNLKEVTIECSFETICAESGEPDSWNVQITYEPQDKLVETVSLREFLNSLRNDKLLVEEAGQEIYDVLDFKLDPEELTIDAEVHPTSSPFMMCSWE